MVIWIHLTIKTYHGSKTCDIKTFIPNYSIHNEAYVFLTTSFEVAIIYTANAIESYYEEKSLIKLDKFQPWYSYGFNKEKVVVID